ncbi:hypothetical protein GCM10017688_01980 [Streptomyces ramulosus]
MEPRRHGGTRRVVRGDSISGSAARSAGREGRFGERSETVKCADSDVISASKLEEVKGRERLTPPRPALEP